MSEDNSDIPAVYQVQGVGYIVESLSTPGAWRLVRGGECSCPAGKACSCRHRRAVAVFCAAQDRRYARPVVPVNVSALVD